VKPVGRQWLLETLERLTGRPVAPRVLVVDDDEVSRYLVASRLGPAGLAVTEAASGAGGLAEVRRQRPDAIVLDLSMPGMSGFDVLERLKEDPVTRGIPVIVLTAGILGEDERRRLAPHVAAILSKGGPSRDASLDGLLDALAGAGLALEGSRA
jgi:CheY-like chemotaxis protein